MSKTLFHKGRLAKLKKTTNNQQKKVISLFTGAGGLDYGLEAAGFHTSIAVEMDKWCVKTLNENRSWKVIERDLLKVSSDEILNKGNLKKHEAALLVGGPPCQPFSKSGYWKDGDSKRLNDPRANTLIAFMRVLEDTLPHAFILENVFGLAYKGKDEGLTYLKNKLEEINSNNSTNYSFNWKVINAADFGVPQIRERVFIVGSKQGKEFNFPEPRFVSIDRKQNKSRQLSFFDDDKETYRTSWDAIFDLHQSNEDPSVSQIGGKWGDLLPTIPPGENYLWHTSRGGGEPIFKWRSRFWSFLLKLHPEKPSWTIQAQPGSAIGPFHWNNRRLTMREMARIQTFPDDVEILGGKSIVQKQLGNAVPSAIGELLGLEIRKQFFDEKISSSKLALIPEKASKSCSPYVSPTISPKYLELQLAS